MSRLRLLTLLIIVFTLVACGGSSDGAKSGNRYSGSHNTYFEDSLYSDIEFTNRSIELYNPNNYTSPLGSSPNGLEGTWLVIEQAIYTNSLTYHGNVAEVKTLKRKVSNIIQADNGEFWLIDSYNEASGYVFFEESNKLFFQHQIYGDIAIAEVTSQSDTKIVATLEQSNYVDVTDSRITFIKLSHTPSLGGVYKDNTQFIGSYSYEEMDTINGTTGDKFEDKPIHSYQDGFLDVRLTEEGEEPKHYRNEYLSVSTIQEDMNLFAEAPSAGSNWQMFWSEYYMLANEFETISTANRLYYRALIDSYLSKFVLDPDYVYTDIEETSINIYYDNYVALRTSSEIGAEPRTAVSLDIKVDLNLRH